MNDAGTAVQRGRELTLALELGRWAAVRMRQDARARANGAARDHDRVKQNAADLVTGTDEAIEQHVRRTLAGQFPRHGVLGEEFGVTDAAPGHPVWVVDPVDGTTNFAHGLGWSAFSIGLIDDAGPVLGVVVDPWRREVFSALRGRGARCNRRRLQRPDPAVDLAGGLVLTEWAGHLPWPGMAGVLAQLQGRHCTVRVMGSTALTLVQVAAGRAAAAVIGSYHAIDAMPAALIGIEAGAVAVDVTAAAGDRGRRPEEISLPADGGCLLLAAPAVAAELVELWRGAVSPGPANG
ncbi:MAG TPA: inositol monophosphatase family protein [Kineosporiaceae bacterium]|nr:inositol monophosphatase family protein [Kineosporiaceae bacterium]